MSCSRWSRNISSFNNILILQILLQGQWFSVLQGPQKTFFYDAEGHIGLPHNEIVVQICIIHCVVQTNLCRIEYEYGGRCKIMYWTFRCLVTYIVIYFTLLLCLKILNSTRVTAAATDEFVGNLSNTEFIYLLKVLLHCGFNDDTN